MPEIYGNNTISQLAPRRVYRPNVGWSTERRFRGLIGSLNAEAASILSASPNVEIQIDPPQDDVGEGVMTVRFPDAQDGSSADSNVLIVWGCPNQTRERSLLDSDAFLQIGYTTPGDPTSDLNSDGYNLDQFFNDSTYYKVAEINALTGDVKKFAKAIASQHKQYLSNVFTLRVSMTAPSSWTVPNLQQYVDVVFSRSQIVSLFSPPANIITQMPTSPEGEYLCTRAELEQTDKGGWHVVIEWAHAKTSWEFIYTRWT